MATPNSLVDDRWIGLLNELVLDAVNTLRKTPNHLIFCAGEVMKMSFSTSKKAKDNRIDQLRYDLEKLRSAIRFIESDLFDHVCTVLSIPSEKAFTKLKNDTRPLVLKAMEAAQEAEAYYERFVTRNPNITEGEKEG